MAGPPRPGGAVPTALDLQKGEMLMYIWTRYGICYSKYELFCSLLRF